MPMCFFQGTWIKTHTCTETDILRRHFRAHTHNTQISTSFISDAHTIHCTHTYTHVHHVICYLVSGIVNESIVQSRLQMVWITVSLRMFRWFRWVYMEGSQLLTPRAAPIILPPVNMRGFHGKWRCWGRGMLLESLEIAMWSFSLPTQWSRLL